MREIELFTGDKVRGLAKVKAVFNFAAYSLIRIPKLTAATG
jgi:hypothetical protein